MPSFKKIHGALALILAAVFIFTSCSSRGEKEKLEDDLDVLKPGIPSFVNLLPRPSGPDPSTLRLNTGLTEKALEKYELNDDTIGWLQLPNTSIDNVVMFYPDKSDKFFYLRRDFNKQDSFDGTYFADYRSTFGDGRENISQNTVIYGHSMSDNPDTPLFSQLKKYWNEQYARENPYIYFSDMEEDMAWEIFALYITSDDFSYNIPNPKPESFKKIIDESRSRSMYDYSEVEVDEDDKILTLSTCLYSVDGVNQGYPNNYRYVVMAKLVPLGEKLKDTAVLTSDPEAVRS